MKLNQALKGAVGVEIPPGGSEITVIGAPDTVSSAHGGAWEDSNAGEGNFGYPQGAFSVLDVVSADAVGSKVSVKKGILDSYVGGENHQSNFMVRGEM
eukprot:scaffold60504_cov49-Cyclotella_meneghiniana.AAC.2